MLSATLPGRAQTTGSSRFAFSDTTLLRDTLGLSFPRLFPLSDSLAVLPDTLRALSIRYLWSLERLVQLADSLGVPVDSVGPQLQRERFNPLAARGVATTFTYSTGYDVGQTQSNWRNTADYGLQRGAVFVTNSTTVLMDRYQIGGGTSLRQSRLSATEVGWRFSPNFSLGGRVGLERLDTSDPTSSRSIGDAKNEYQISMRSRQKPLPGMTSSINFLSGMIDIDNASVEKRGISGSLNSQIRYAPAAWLTQELTGAMDGNLSRTRSAGVSVRQNTRDYSQNVRGSVSLFAAAPVSLKGGFTFRHVQVETPADTVTIRRLLSDNLSGDVTLRWRLDSDRSFEIALRHGEAKQVSASGAQSRTTRRDDSFSASGRYLLWGSSLDGRFQNGFSDAKFPTRSDSGGYGELAHSRSLDGSISRQLTSRLTARLSGSISLTSYRYSVIGRYGTPPVTRDQWRQTWRAEGRYTPGDKLSTGVTLDVSKSKLINIPGASTGTNNGTRSYSAEWRWSYRLLPGLTATQRNTLGANYVEYTFFRENNRLTLDYATVTTLSAVVTPRLSMSITQNSRRSPAGSFTLFPDGVEYFGRADENENATLSASVAYTPSPAISFTVEPGYFSSSRTGTVNGAAVPQRDSRSLNVSGGAVINWPITSKGLLRGDLRRSYRADRSTSYTSGVPQFSPRSETDFWNGSLQLSWRL